MYLWKLVGNNASQDRMRSGLGDDLPAIMRRLEGDLLDGSAFVARVYEVVFRVSVSDLGEIHVPTGREWHGRRDGHGGVHWGTRATAALPPAAPGAAAVPLDEGSAFTPPAVQLPPGSDLDAVTS